jgi:hypothetical protein
VPLIGVDGDSYLQGTIHLAAQITDLLNDGNYLDGIGAPLQLHLDFQGQNRANGGILLADVVLAPTGRPGIGGGFAVAHPEIGEYIRLEGTREVVYVMIETKASEYQTTQNRGSFIDREGERS